MTGAITGRLGRAQYLAALFLFIYGSGSVSGAEYSFQRSVKFNSEYRETDFGGGSNDRLTEFNLFPEFAFEKATDRSSLSAELDSHFRRYDEERYDSDEYRAQVSYSREFERSEHSVSGSARRTSTFIDRIEGNDGAQNFSSSQETDTQAINARSTFLLTERKSLTFSTSFVNREYKQSDRFDSQSVSLNIRFSNRFTERFSGILLLNGSNFESDDDGFQFNIGGVTDDIRLAYPGFDDIGNAAVDAQLLPVAIGVCAAQDFTSFIDINDVGAFVFGGFEGNQNVAPRPCYSSLSQRNDSRVAGLQMGFSFALTENLALNALAGASRIFTDREVVYDLQENDDIFLDRNNDTETWDASLSYRRPISSYSFSVNRSTYADSEGGIELRENANFSYRVDLGETFSSAISFGWLKEESAFDDFELEDRERWTAGWTITKAISRYWSAIFRYRYYNQDQKFRFDSEQHAVRITLLWNPRTINWSR